MQGARSGGMTHHIQAGAWRGSKTGTEDMQTYIRIHVHIHVHIHIHIHVHVHVHIHIHIHIYIYTYIYIYIHIYTYIYICNKDMKHKLIYLFLSMHNIQCFWRI